MSKKAGYKYQSNKEIQMKTPIFTKNLKLTALFLMLFMLFFTTEKVNAQGACDNICNIVKNGTFNTNLTGWTGDITTTDDKAWRKINDFGTGGYAGNTFESSTGQKISQNLTGLNFGPVANQVKLTFTLGLGNIHGNAGDQYSLSTLRVSLGSTVYATFVNPNGSNTAVITPQVPGVTITTSPSSPYNFGGSPWSVTTNVTLTIPWSGKPNSADLSFLFTSDGDDIIIDDIAIQACFANPLITTTPPTCPATAGTATISNFDNTSTYTFSPTGPIVNTTTGVISGMTSGTCYTVNVTTPGGCVAASAPFSITPPLCLTADNYQGNAGTAFTTPTSILVNDNLGGSAPVIGSAAGQVTISQTGTWPTGISLNTTNGTIGVASTVAGGVYVVNYQTCVNVGSGGCSPVCSTQTVTITVCGNLPNTNPADSFTKTGISNLAGFANGWPGNVPNGFIAIESTNKGFVITRIQNVGVIPVANLVEGMLVYDIDAGCVKLYNGTKWNCIAKSCN